MSTFNEHKISNVNQECQLKDGKLMVTANLREYCRLERELQNLGSEDEVLKQSLEVLMHAEIKKVWRVITYQYMQWIKENVY